jgi:hypothetical protein
MNIVNLYKKKIIPVIEGNHLYLIYQNRLIKTFGLSFELDKIYIGNPILEFNPIYSVQKTTTQGLPALNIFNHYDVPIFVNEKVLQPRCQLRYKGAYDNGIPYGEILRSSFDEDVVITSPATNLHYGLLYFE